MDACNQLKILYKNSINCISPPDSLCTAAPSLGVREALTGVLHTHRDVIFHLHLGLFNFNRN